MNILKNQRLHIVLLAVWLIASFIIVRIPIVEFADSLYQIQMSSCYEQNNKSLIVNCLTNATKDYRAHLQISNQQFIDILALFLIPIILVLIFILTIKWVMNCKK